jgi:HlyD family secretion protein
MSTLKTIAQFVFRAKVLVPLLILVGAVIGTQVMKRQAEKVNSERYRTTAVDRGTVQQRITANGTLNPVTVVNVGTQVSGTVMKLYTDYNQPVKAGQVLLELDAALIRASVAQIEANVKSAEATQRLAESTLKRNQDLVNKGFISPATLEQNQKELDVAKSQVAQVRSQLDREKTNLDYTVIRSPINGTIIDRKVDVGQTVAASFNTPTLFQIAKDLEKMQIDTSVSEADVGRLKDAMPVRFTVDAFPDRDFQGKIRMVRLNPTIQQNVVTYNVIVDVANDEGVLKPGMTAQVSMVVATKNDVVRIPNAALRFKPPRDDKDKDLKGKPDKGGATKTAQAPAATESDAGKGENRRRPPTRVYKVNEKNELAAVDVQTGVASNQFSELISGDIKPGDELVVRDTMDKNAKK